MEERSNSELDNLFQSRLNNLEGDESSWNVPSDSVFEGALGVIDAQDKKKRKVVVLWAASILVVAFIIGMTVWNYRMIQLVDQKVEELRTGRQLAGTNVQETAEMQHDEQVPLQDSAQEELAATAVVDTGHKDEGSVAGTHQTGVKQSKPSVAGKEVKEETGILSMKGAPFAADLSGPNRLTASSTFLEIPYRLKLPEDVENKQAWDLAFQFGPGASTLKMQASGSLASLLTQYDDWYPGFSLGLRLRNEIKPGWKVFGDLTFDVVNNQSNFTTEHAYIKSNESTMPDGSLEYSAAMPIMSPVHQQSEQFRIPVSQNQIVNNEILTCTTDFNDRFSYAHTGVGISRTLYTKGNFSFDLSTQIGANFLIGFYEEMDAKVYQGEGMLSQKQQVDRTIEDLRRVFLSGGLGLGFEYKLNRQTTVGLRLVHDWSLQPMQSSGGMSLDMNKANALITIGRPVWGTKN